MDFDIDAALDQLEQSIVNQTIDENKINTQTIDVAGASSTINKSSDDLLLLDLDPLAPKNDRSNEDSENDLQRLKFDIQELFSNISVNNSVNMATSTLPDVIAQQDDIPSMTVNEAVEQLEIEVRQEILQHTFESSNNVNLLPDLTTVSNGVHEDDDFIVDQFSLPSPTEQNDQEQLSAMSLADEINLITTKTVENEPDLIQHDNLTFQPALHSVDSIVNASNINDLQNGISTPVETIIDELIEQSNRVEFTTGDDQEENENRSNEDQIDSFYDSNRFLSNTNLEDSIQNFDLVKNVLSDIIDKPEDLVIDETTIDENLLDNFPINNESEQIERINPDCTDEDFRFLDEMLSGVDVSDSDIHQLTPAEIERVDMLLKQIVDGNSKDLVNSQIESESTATEGERSETAQNPNTTIDEQVTSSAPVENVPSERDSEMASEPSTIDEELVRVEQEWSRLTEDERRLGSVAPEWVSDDQAASCMKCNLKFTITRRRHHCRACGKIFCSTCCSQKIKLIHEDNREDRTCNDCIRIISRVEYLWNYMRNNQKPRSSVLRKKTGTTSLTASASNSVSATRSTNEQKKSVIFDDGIRPGLETPSSTMNLAATAASNIITSNRLRSVSYDFDQQNSFKPETLNDEEFQEKLKKIDEIDGEPVEFQINKNLFVISKIFEKIETFSIDEENKIWIFSTRGLATVAQDELVFAFLENEIKTRKEFICELLLHVNKIYLDAKKGSFIRHFSLSLGSDSSSNFLGSPNGIGFLYVSDPSVTHKIFPEFPYLFGVLINRDELPTGQCFPIRILTRLGLEFRKYPWCLTSFLNRPTMFNDHQHTIMSLLCDFRSYTYTIPTIRGLLISIGNQGSVSIRIPRNRHEDIVKSLEQSSPHALSFGVLNVVQQIHSKQLITIQNPVDNQYETRLFVSPTSNSEQILIGGSFLVINASLRSRDSPSTSPLDGNQSSSFSSLNNLNAKVNTIEDGIMLQLDGETLKILKQFLRERRDYSILARARAILFDEQKQNPDGNALKKLTSEQLVEFLWVDDDNEINRGVRSPIDEFPMEGIRSSRIHYAGQRSPLFRLRWTDLFFIQSNVQTNENSFDATRLADSLAKGFTQALTPYVDMLIEGKYRKLGLRVTIDRENASYIAGSNGEQLSSFFLSQLDDQMIPIVMKASDSFTANSSSLILELVFYVLN